MMASLTIIENNFSLEHDLLEALQRDKFKGFDPFDLLNSKFLEGFEIGEYRILELLAIQFGKRFPVNLRNILRVEKSVNPKGVALVVLSLLNRYQREGSLEHLDLAKNLGEYLLLNCCDKTQWGSMCWGYNFPWRSRAFFVQRNTPNLVVTYFCFKALNSLAKFTNDDKFSEVALAVSKFIRSHLHVHHGGKSYFKYVPNSTALIHNINIFGSLICFQAGEYIKDNELFAIGQETLETTLKAQLCDGSFPYGDLHHHQFIDSFHSGYVLDGLWEINQLAYSKTIEQTISKGYRHFKNAFITDRFDIKYYDDKIYPLDVHCFAQAIITILTHEQGTESGLLLATKVFERMQEQFFDKSKGYFYYRRYPFYVNKVNYMRWTQAWALLAASKINLEYSRNDA